jgi:S-DNA-T family DNA segregation ATPase FtsK/SpoIIIE
MANEERAQSANFNRPPRIQFPGMEVREVNIPSPPTVPDLPEQSLLVSILPVAGIGMMAIFYVIRSASSGGDSLLFALPMLLMAGFTIGGTLLAQKWRKRDHEKREREAELNYIRILDKKRARLQAAHDAQIAILQHDFPETPDWLNLALTYDQRLWERRQGDDDFASMRIGVGRIPSVVKINIPDPDTDSEGLDRAFILADEFRFLNNAPVVVSLQNDISIGFCGKRAPLLKAVRAAICDLALTHAPQDFHIHVVASPSSADDWRWMEWLPHASQSHRGGAADLVALDANNVRNLMGNLSQIIDERKEQKGAKSPHLLLIVDDPQLVETESVYSTILRDGNQVGASAICLVNSFENIPSQCGAVVEIVNDDQFRYARIGADGVEIEGNIIDALSMPDAESIARALSSIVIREIGTGGRIPRRVDFLDVYGVRYVEELRDKVKAKWFRQIRKGIIPFPVPIGRESLAVETVIALDEETHGPHGMLAGTTGSGKSELLQTLICALVIEHDPRLLTLLLIDFKGGATFNVFADLPHTVGTVTNLDSIRVSRALEALKAETAYRQQFLESMNVRDINQYHRFYVSTPERFNDPTFKALPHLFIIVDEFAQLAKEMPDFMRELVRTVQVGRSLGLHLLLGTQSPMDVITDEMNANLQFRICLRVQNVEASRAMLRRPDAAFLPSGWPGRGYFQVGAQGMFKQFQTAYVGADYERKRVDEVPEEKIVLEVITGSGDVVNLMPDTRTSLPVSGNGNVQQQSIQPTEPYTVAKAICETLTDFAKTEAVPWMKPLLLPPLEDRLSLAAPFTKSNAVGWNGVQWLAPGEDHEGSPILTGSAPVGILDDVYNRTQHPLWINLNTSEGGRTNRKDGHVIVMGSPGTGKTSFIRTLAVSLALLHAPEKLNMYFLSFTGTGLDELGSLPHAERTILGTETERVRRLFGRLIQTLDARQTGRAEPFNPNIMVAIDQYEQFRDTYRDQHMSELERLISEGRAVGIYVVLTANSPSAIPDRIRSLVQQRIALQLGDSTDYIMAVGRTGGHGDEDLPNGRGFFSNSPPLACQISLPCLRMPEDDQDTLAGMTQIIESLRMGYMQLQNVTLDATITAENQQAPPPIAELPTKIPLHTLPTHARRQNAYHMVTPIGRRDDDALTTFSVDWWEDGPHFIVTGPPGSGKTNLLQAAILSAAQHHSPDHLRFLLVDFNGRSLRALTNLKHVIRRVSDVSELKSQLRDLASEMNAFAERAHDMTGDGSAPPEIPATVVVIDDYDPTSEALSANPELLMQLRDHVRLHSELGLYIWIAGYLERTTDPLIKQLLLRRSGFGLMIRDSLLKLNVRTTGLPADAMPEGRTYVPQHNRIEVVQTALIENPQTYVTQLNDKVWKDHARATWLNPAQGDEQPLLPEMPVRTMRHGDLAIDTPGLIQDLLIPGKKPKKGKE